MSMRNFVTALSFACLASCGSDNNSASANGTCTTTCAGATGSDTTASATAGGSDAQATDGTTATATSGTTTTDTSGTTTTDTSDGSSSQDDSQSDSQSSADTGATTAGAGGGSTTTSSSTGGSSDMQSASNGGSSMDDPAGGSNSASGGASAAGGSDASAGASAGGGDMMIVDDAGPSSSRLTAVPIGTTDAQLGFWEYLPPGYGDEPVPLLVFTHGASWQGEGTPETLQNLLEVGPPNLLSTDEWPNDRPFLVLSPQNPRAGCFDPDDIDAFYHYALDTYNIDTQRIYHTGQSCGAIGAWNYLAGHLDEFVTAAVLISGDGRDAFDQAGCDLGRVAIWGLHNEMDMTVDSQGTIVPISGLLDCDPAPDVRLSIYPGETAHDAWTKTYDLSAGNDIYSWLLDHVHP